MFRETFGERIERLRSLSDMSARELDALAGLCAGHVRLIETGVRAHVETRTAAQIAVVFGVTLDWLYAGGGPTPARSRVLASVQDARATRPRKATTT